MPKGRTQAPHLCPSSHPLPLPTLPASSAGGWGFLVYEFPSLLSLHAGAGARAHTHTISAFLPFLPVLKGLQIPFGQGLGASECLRRTLITPGQLELDSILSDAF